MCLINFVYYYDSMTDFLQYICYIIYVLYKYMFCFISLFLLYISLYVWTHLLHRMPSKGHCKSPFHLSGLIADTVAAFLLLHTSSKSTQQSQSQHNEARRRNSLSQWLWLWTSPCDVSSWYISGLVGNWFKQSKYLAWFCAGCLWKKWWFKTTPLK